ncbi:3'-5' exonuclease [Kiritimatiellota bacterium B12222]|nr:3'-5' exonuclease [Kiritimatiellota bacterium B12222]
MKDFVAFDLETTGIQPLEDGIVEIGAVKFLDGLPQKDFCFLVNPGMEIPLEAYKVHGISNEDVKDAPRISELMGAFTDYCGDLPLIAHNAKFDFKFLETAVKRDKCKAPTGQVLDTYGLSKKVFPGMLNYRLETLTKYFEFPNTVFHRASEDAEYCGKVFLRIIETLEKNDISTSVESLVQLGEMREMKLPQIAPAGEQLGLF